MVPFGLANSPPTFERLMEDVLRGLPCVELLLYTDDIISPSRSVDEEKKGKRKVQGVPQSQTAALPSHQDKKKPTNTNKHKSNKRTKDTKISALFPKRGNRNTKRTENTRTK